MHSATETTRSRERRARSRVGIVATLALAACTPPVAVAPYGATLPKRPPVPTDSVRVFFDEGGVPGPFERIAMLSTHARWDRTDAERVVAALKAKAGRIGANAVVVFPITDPRGGERVAALIIPGVGEVSGSALAIFLVSPTATPGLP